jgi:2-oxoglutarate ferredoxin oxidoreductase subunit delta
MKYWRTPLDLATVKIPRGELKILIERCKGCGFCVEFCPKQILQLSHQFNRKGYHPPYIIKSNSCINCHLCEIICPEFAIFSLEAGTASPEISEVLDTMEEI